MYVDDLSDSLIYYLSDLDHPKMYVYKLNFETLINTQLEREIKLRNFKQPKLIKHNDAFYLHGGYDHFSKYYPSEIYIRYSKTD